MPRVATMLLALCLCSLLTLLPARRHVWRQRRWMARHDEEEDSVRRDYPAGVLPPRRRCSWDTGVFAMAPEARSGPTIRTLQAFLTFLDSQVFRRLGYLYSLRDGNLCKFFSLQYLLFKLRLS